MQQIDSSFDEKNVGKAKFSLFVAEAAKRGLVALNKLENGQLEVDLPRPASSADVPAAAVALPSDAVSAPAAATTAVASDEEEKRGSRSRRGGRGRGREREDRAPKEAKPEAAAAPSAAPAKTDAPPAPAAAIAAPSAPAAPSATAAPAAKSDGIGATGLRLTRDEAFDLVKRAVAAAVTGGKSVSASKVRASARTILGRDSESLSERNFIRILHDAHDADVIDLRKRGGDYEVAPAAAAPPVERQLETAAAANAPAPKPQAPVVRGMGSRGIGRGPMGAKAGVPENLLKFGVVSTAKPATPAAAPTNTAKAPDDAEAVAIVEAAQPEKAARPAAKKRGAAKKAAPKTDAVAAPHAAAKKARGRKKPAAKTPAGTAS